MPREQTGPRRLAAWVWPLLTLPIVAGVGGWTYRVIARAEEARLRSVLQTMVGSDVSSLGHWLDGQANLAEVMASDPRVWQDVKGLIAISRRTGADPAALKAASAQAHLREVLAPVVSRQENAGYFILDPGGLIIARIVDESVSRGPKLDVDVGSRVRSESLPELAR